MKFFKLRIVHENSKLKKINKGNKFKLKNNF